MRKKLILLSAVSAIFVLPSARLWFQPSLVLTPYEFDYWLGLFAHLHPDVNAAFVLAGRLVHLTGFLVVGWLFAEAVGDAEKAPGTPSLAEIAGFGALLTAIWTLAMPWVSPDVFFYIGTGWLDAHHGLSPYVHGMSAAPDFAREEMFRNVFPGFLSGRTAYGPLFQALARLIAQLSGGHEWAAFALFKLLAVMLHAACGALVFWLAPPPRRKVALLAFICSPIVLFSGPTCAHNDGLMVALVLAALLAQRKGHLECSGLLLGAATSAKYASLVLLPLFLIDALVTGSESLRKRALGAARLGLAFVVAIVAAHALYPDALPRFQGVAAQGISVYRNSIYIVIAGVSGWRLLPGPMMWRTLVVVFCLVAGASILWLWREAAKTRSFRLADASFVVWGLFFVILNQSNQEWYLTWLLALAAAVSSDAGLLFSRRLNLIFLPLVIFTVKNEGPLLVLSNALLYTVLVASLVPTFRSLLFPVTEPSGDGGGRPASGDRPSSASPM